MLDLAEGPVRSRRRQAREMGGQVRRFREAEPAHHQSPGGECGGDVAPGRLVVLDRLLVGWQ